MDGPTGDRSQERAEQEGEAFMTDDDKLASRSRPVETTEGAMDEHKARQKAERAKTAQLRTLRLAAEAKAADAPKRKPRGKAKR